jgi:hypothetical protein
LSAEILKARQVSAALLITCFTVLGTVWFLASVAHDIFQPYFGGLFPPFAAAIVGAAGIPALLLLQKRWGFEVYNPDLSGRDRLVAAALAIPFMIAVTLADLMLGFPDGINVSLPYALLFYPSMGLIAQFALHIIPLAILLSTGAILSRKIGRRGLVLLCIAAVALIEAIFQIPETEGGIALLSGFVALHVFIFGVVELLIFRRYDFVSMYVFRLSYYSWWHIAWGWLRL